MSIHDLLNHVRQQAHCLGLSTAELARRTQISRPSMIKLLNAEVQCPEILTLTNLAYAIDDHPMRLFSLFLAGMPPPVRTDGSVRVKRDARRFVRDVTMPDGALVHCGQRFTKIWEILNAGSQTWSGRSLRCVDQATAVYRKEGDSFVECGYTLTPARTLVSIPDTAPGQSVLLEVDFVAPQTPAWVISHWKMFDQQGQVCFPALESLRCCVSVIYV